MTVRSPAPAPTSEPALAAGDGAPDSAGGALSLDAEPFRRAFRGRARRVRARLALRQALFGVVVGLVVGVVGAVVAWRLRLGELRPWMAAAGALGAVVGLLVAARQRWDDGRVALWLDKRLGSHEAIATAVELAARAARPGGDEVRGAVLDEAARALRAPAAPRLGPAVWHRAYAIGLLAACAIGLLSFAPLPPTPPPPPPAPGSETVKIGQLVELDAVIRLAELDARDEAQRQRLRELADRARKLKERLAAGMPKREAQDEIAKLRESVAAERARFGSGEQRAGLEAALGKLGTHSNLKDAQRALGDRDLTAFDEQMERLANKLELRDREEARKALEEAAEAARDHGAEDVAKALEEQQRLLAERGDKADKLRELAKAFGEGLSPEAREALKDLKGSGSPEAAQELADALEKALAGLSDEERKRLADKLREQAKSIDPDAPTPPPASKQQLEELERQLSTPEGQKQLAEQLREMAKEQGPQSGEAQREQGLGEAEKGLGRAQRQLGAMPVPGPGSPTQGSDGAPKSPSGGQGKSPGGSNGKAGDGSGEGPDDGDGQGGPSRGGGRGSHGGTSKPVAADSFRSKANARINPGKPMPGTVLGRLPGREGETANRVGTGELGAVGPAEVGAAEHSEIPKEYQEQVGRYFQPE